MKVLYGIQGTGNGHISRANSISSELKKFHDIEVDWLVSGREPNALLQVHGKQSTRRGLTFFTVKGAVSYLHTATKNNLAVFFKDITQLDLSGYDVVVSDYEPVVSWAAKLRSVPVLGIGHQYAFNYNIPKKGDHFFNRMLIRQFAPASVSLGLHWHHFNHPILPPILPPNWPPSTTDTDKRQGEKVIVYLPFEDQGKILQALAPLTNYQFVVYGPQHADQSEGHIHTRALSLEGFKKDLISANAAITNTGFELISECLSIGVKVLTKPVERQVEQLSNGAALSQLRYATVTDDITTDTCRRFLLEAEAVKVTYPNVQESIAHLLAQLEPDKGRWQISNRQRESLCHALWKDVKVIRGRETNVPAPRTQTA